MNIDTVVLVHERRREREREIRTKRENESLKKNRYQNNLLYKDGDGQKWPCMVWFA